MNPQKASDLYARIISAEKIEDFGNGVYLINQGQFYIQFDNSIISTIRLRSIPSGQELLIPISTSGEKSQIKYSLIY